MPFVSNFDIGSLIDDRYEVLSILGKGGMGVVYKVNDTLLSQVVALKTLLPDFVQHREALTRFINEAKVSLKLNHANIIRVYDIRRLEDIYYMTMEYIEGLSLYDWLKEDRGRDIGQTLEILRKICAGLEYAHRMGTFHRDIKPANIMMTKGGNVLLVDFGLAKLADGMGDLTRMGVAGTPNYMAPEQKNRVGEIDQRIDIYAMGVMAFEMFTGELPSFYTMASQLNPKLNTRVDEVLIKALAPTPEERYGNILTFFEDLEKSLTTKTVLPKEKKVISSDTETALSAEKETQIKKDKPKTPDSYFDMNIVPAGHFWMGSSPNESKNETEKPRHRILLPTFYIDKYLVTNQLYRSFVKETGYQEPLFWADLQFNHPMQPVVGVSWYDAMEYARWAGKRLPTEAEWEKAAKGEKNLIYPWGNEFTGGMANVDYVMSGTSPTGQFASGISAYRCFDMIGNVWEWCFDWFQDTYYSMSVNENPRGPEKGQKKVLRGSAWDTISFNARNAFRFFSDPKSKTTNIGFRCVVDE